MFAGTVFHVTSLGLCTISSSAPTANWQQGRAIVDQLRGDGCLVCGLRRRVPQALTGVEWTAGDLDDLESLHRAFDGVTHVSLTIPLTSDETAAARYVDNVIAAADRAGVRRLVFNTSIRRIPRRTGVAAFDIKGDAEDALLRSGIPTVVLRPPVFLDNLAAPWPKPRWPMASCPIRSRRATGSHG